jgi:flavin reductase (DIM6/NTAB) family NADH-FMN oxidoreductase RutF
MDYGRIAPMMTHLWAPMAAITSAWQGKHNAQIAVAISAASIVPGKPRVSIKIQKRNLTHELIYRSGAFAVNFLRTDQLELISAFGLVSGREVEKLTGVPYRLGPSGSPVLERCWGYLDCRIVNVLDGGDLTCFLGDVLEGDTFTDLDTGTGTAPRSQPEHCIGPLWWRDAQRQLPAEIMEEWDKKISQEREFSEETMDRIDFTPWHAAETE